MDVDGVSSEVNFVDFGSGVVELIGPAGWYLFPSSGLGARFCPGVSEIDIFVSSVVISTTSLRTTLRGFRTRRFIAGCGPLPVLQARTQGFLAGRLRLEFGKQFFRFQPQ